MTRAKRRPRSTTRTPDGRPTCYRPGCDRAAGHGRSLAYSAFCELHQPHRPAVPGAGWLCPAGCGQIWGTCTLFDLHQQIDNSQARSVTCLAPSELGVPLVQAPDGTWMSPEGLAKRSRLAGMSRWPDHA